MVTAPAAHDHTAPLETDKAIRPVVLIALDHYPERPVEIGGLITVVAVHAANVVRDIRENIRNLVGGRMVHYERLIQGAIDAALADLQTVAREKGYDGVLGVKISHPTVVEGGVEVIVYGNGFRWRTAPSESEQE
ncbi:MAG: heavy metal-binding domain-containing protein [Caldilineaceae bacterium]